MEGISIGRPSTKQAMSIKATFTAPATKSGSGKKLNIKTTGVNVLQDPLYRGLRWSIQVDANLKAPTVCSITIKVVGKDSKDLWGEAMGKVQITIEIDGEVFISEIKEWRALPMKSAQFKTFQPQLVHEERVPAAIDSGKVVCVKIQHCEEPVFATKLDFNYSH